MKKQRRAGNKTKAKTQPSAKANTSGQRRDFLRLARNGLIVAGLVGAGGAYAVSAVRATAHEQDLSRVGSGLPSIVQIHDPQCSLCTALQRETRKALKDFTDEDIDYMVANIRTTEGSAFAAQYGQPHVTLMLFDPDGEPVEILNGPQERDVLREIFARHVEAYR